MHQDTISIPLSLREQGPIAQRLESQARSPPPVIIKIPQYTDFSSSPFSPSDLNQAISRWRSVLQAWFEETDVRDSGRRDSELHESYLIIWSSSYAVPCVCLCKMQQISGFQIIFSGIGRLHWYYIERFATLSVSHMSSSERTNTIWTQKPYRSRAILGTDCRPLDALLDC